MRFGVCSWTFGEQPLETTAQEIAELGYDGVELLSNLQTYSARDSKNILGDLGLEIFSLTPMDADISHPDETIRQAGIDYFYRLIDFAGELDGPLISCHGLVQRIRPIATLAEEYNLLVDSMQKITARAGQVQRRIVFEVLNRYEAHQINNHQQAIQLVTDVGADNLGVLLDAYHMNIEEANPANAIETTGEQLWLYHTADSNREAIGRGHTDMAAQFEALRTIGYDGAVIVECNAPGPDPFTYDKGEGWRDVLKVHLAETLTWFEEHAG